MSYGDGLYDAGGYGWQVWRNHPETGGLTVTPGGPPGGMVHEPGQLQYGDLLLGNETRCGWRDLAGWRDTPEVQLSDSPRPQAHGAYPGAVYADALTVTFTGLLRGTPDEKVAALNALEAHTPLDGVERALVVDDGDGPWLRWGRVIGRQVPQDRHFRHAPVEVGVQWLCADPRRYSLTEYTHTVRLPSSTGGLAYPVTYPLDYGEWAGGSVTAVSGGSEPTPPMVTFIGPLTAPRLVTSGWVLGFDLTLTDGESLVVDTSAGTALLNGTADRLYTIRNDSTPLERCLLAPGSTNLTLTATSGTGRAVVTYRDARL